MFFLFIVIPITVASFSGFTYFMNQSSTLMLYGGYAGLLVWFYLSVRYVMHEINEFFLKQNKDNKNYNI